MSFYTGLADLAKEVGSVYLGVETIKAGAANNGGNTASDYPHVNTGVDSDGSTIVPTQLVAGVANSALLGGALLLMVVAGGYYALAND